MFWGAVALVKENLLVSILVLGEVCCLRKVRGVGPRGLTQR